MLTIAARRTRTLSLAAHADALPCDRASPSPLFAATRALSPTIERRLVSQVPVQRISCGLEPTLAARRSL